MKYSLKKLLFIALIMGSLTQFVPYARATGLSTPEDSYVLVFDTVRQSGRDEASFSLHRQPHLGTPQRVWSTGDLITKEYINIYTSQIEKTPWPGDRLTHSKSIILKSSTNTAQQPIALLAYSPHLYKSNGGKMVIINGEQQPTASTPAVPRHAHAIEDFVTMARLSNDHALVMRKYGGVRVINADGQMESVYLSGQSVGTLLPTGDVVDMEVLGVQLKSPQSYLGATFHLAVLHNNSVSLAYIKTSAPAGSASYFRMSLDQNFRPFKILTRGDFIFVFSQDVSNMLGTVVSIFQTTGSLDENYLTARFRRVAEYYLIENLTGTVREMHLRNTPNPTNTCTAEILGLVENPLNPIPLVSVRQGAKESYYSLPPQAYSAGMVSASGPIAGAHAVTKATYNGNQYARMVQGSLVAPEQWRLSVMGDTDPVPGSVVLGAVAQVATSTKPQVVNQVTSQWQSIGQSLTEALRVQRPPTGATFQVTGDVHADTLALLSMLMDDLKKVAPKQATALEAKSLEELTFSMQEFVTLINVTPRFKFLLQSHLNFRQRDALGFFWDFNGIRSHNFIPLESERISLSHVIRELLRGEGSSSRCEAALQNPNGEESK